jgi:hypothetical protein
VVPRLGTDSEVSAAAPQVAAVGRLAGRLERVRPLYVLSALVVVEWLTILGVAQTVRHNGWLYYQGTDQLQHYVDAWLLGHGHAPHTSVGYGWSMVLLPFALLGGANLMSPLPFIVLVNVLVLMPIALLSVYGIARRVGGRLFGYWAVVLWIVVPLIGIKYADAGYHQRYTELLLPQALGLTASAVFPSIVLLAAAAYFAVRALQDGRAFDAVFSGLLAGVALGVNPANAPFLAGAVPAFVVARRFGGLMRFAAGVLPSFLVLLLWTGRGLDLHLHVDPSWHTLTAQFASLQEHFWSARVVEWLPVAGAVGLLRASRPIGALVAGWFACVVVVTWANSHGGTIEDTSVLRHTIPALPAALLLLASIPLLLPRLPQRLHHAEHERAWGSRELRLGLVGALLAVFVLLPAALTIFLPELDARETVSYSLAAEPGFQGEPASIVDAGWRPSATRSGSTIRVSWPALHPLGGTMAYLLLRSRADAVSCRDGACSLGTSAFIPATVTSASEQLPTGRWTYRVAAVASWLDDPTQGAVYTMSRPVTVTAG